MYVQRLMPLFIFRFWFGLLTKRQSNLCYSNWKPIGKEQTMNQTQSAMNDFAQRVFITLGITSLFALAFLTVWYLPDVLLILFAGILLAVFLCGLANLLNHYTLIPKNLALIIVIVVFFAGMGGLLWLFGPAIVHGFDKLFESLNKTIDQLQQFIQQYNFLQHALQTLRSNAMSLIPERLGRIVGVFSSAIGLATTFFFIVITGIYLSVEPHIYINSSVRLLPINKRERSSRVLYTVGRVLRWWLLGRIASMFVVGILTWIGLFLLNIPSALPLAVLAALLAFIPNIGPVLSAIPAILIGLTQGLWVALYVVLLYIAIQTIESYLITPLIQRHAIAIPPGFLLAIQLLMGVAAGAFGLLLATPLAVVVMVLIKMLYLEDTLGDSITLPHHTLPQKQPNQQPS